VRFPCVHAAATTPVQQMGCSSLNLAPSISAFPDSTVGSACTSSFSRFARRSLALRPAHSRSHQIRDRYPRASDISSPPCLPRLLPAGANRRVGLAPTGKAPPCHDARGSRPLPVGSRSIGVRLQPAIPRRVASQQSPLPLHQSPTIVAQSQCGVWLRSSVALVVSAPNGVSSLLCAPGVISILRRQM
jgi:hypothetical protein